MALPARLAALLLLVVAGSSPARAEPPLPLLHPLFADHAVLQRAAPVPIWGWAEPGSHIEVRFAGQAVEAAAGADRRWQSRLAPLAMSAEGRTLSVVVRDPRGETRMLAVHDVLVGDVWLCSGQSNMEFAVANVTNAEAEIGAARAPGVRLFTVARTTAGTPLEVPASPFTSWTEATPETVRSFSAVAYFFARRVHDATGVPLGVIHSSWGGTPIESWTSAEALAAAPVSAKTARDLAADTDAWETAHRDGR